MTSPGSEELNIPVSDISTDRIDVHDSKGVQIGDHNTQTNTFSLHTDRVDQVNLIFSQSLLVDGAAGRERVVRA
jgi:hypothetical protein